MKKIYYSRKNRGSMTVEASLIFPLIILAIIVVIYICILLYQHAYLQSVANHIAERGAACWSNISKMEADSFDFRLTTGKLQNSRELLMADLYVGDNEEKINRLKKYALNMLKQNNILVSDISKLDSNDIINSKDNVDIWIEDYIIYKAINVKINDSYIIPLGNSLKLFGLDKKYSIDVKSKALINTPVEFIRNNDFIIDTLNEYEATSNLLSEFKDTINEIKQNIDKLSKY